MTSSTTLSIIVPSLNVAATIGAALDSIIVACQQFDGPPPEIVIIDGGSKDDTLKRAWERQAQWPHLTIRHQQSSGLAAARNEGIATTTSALVGFCDADDAWTPVSAQLRRAALDQSTSSWAATGQVGFVSVSGTVSGAPVRRLAGTEHPGYTPGAMLIRRKVFDQVGLFDETLRIGADGDWILRAIHSLGPPVTIPQRVLEKGLRPGSLSTDVATYRAEMMLIARRFIARRRLEAS